MKENLDQLVLDSRDPNHTWNGGASDLPGPPEMTPAVAQTLLEIIWLCEDFPKVTLEVSKEALKDLVDLEFHLIETRDLDGENFIQLLFKTGQYARIDLPKEFIVRNVVCDISKYYHFGHDKAFTSDPDFAANFTDRGLH